MVCECGRLSIYVCLWCGFLDFCSCALLPGYILDGLPLYSGLVASVFTVVIGVLACLWECLHVLLHRVVVQQGLVFPGNSRGYLLATAYGISWTQHVCLCMCVCVCVCVDSLYGWVLFSGIYGTLSYSLFCSGWMHGAHVWLLRDSFIKWHGFDCCYGSEPHICLCHGHLLSNIHSVWSMLFILQSLAHWRQMLLWLQSHLRTSCILCPGLASFLAGIEVTSKEMSRWLQWLRKWICTPDTSSCVMAIFYRILCCLEHAVCPDFLSFSNPKDGEVCNLKIAGPADTRVCGRFCSWHVILQQGCPLPILLILRHCSVMHGVWMLNSV